MEPRLSLVTLGVDDLERAVAFYQAMGLQRHPKFTEGVAFFQLGGLILALWPREELAKDAGIDPLRLRGSGMALAHNTRTEGGVAEVIARAARAGAHVLKPATRAAWGGVQGYFEDPEGNLWEVAWNPDFPIDAEGRTLLPE